MNKELVTLIKSLNTLAQMWIVYLLITWLYSGAHYLIGSFIQ